MKVAYIIPSLSSVGPVIMLKSLIKGLSALEVDVKVYYFDTTSNAVEMYCPIQQISFNKPIDFDKYDVIHSHCFRADLYVFRWQNHIKQAKIVSTLHQNTREDFKYIYPSIFSYIFNQIWVILHRKFDKIICISNQIKMYYTKYFHNNVLETIYNGVDVNLDTGNTTIDSVIKTQIQELVQKGYKIIGTYAKIVKRKGIDQVISVLSTLQDYALVVIGDGPYKAELEKLAKEIGVYDRVLFLPHVEHPYRYLDNIDIYCMPSYSEGFGLAMVESALCGKAIVCSDLPSFHEIFPNGEAVFFEINNEQSLKHAIQRVYEKRDVLGSKCKSRCMEEFTYNIMSEKYLNIYKRLVDNI